MQEIAKAIQRFRQDTGYYPKTGPFDLKSAGGEVVTGKSDAWFYSPANLDQLTSITSPLPDTHQLFKWEPETGRGWRGPYLKGHDDGIVSISDNLNSVVDLTADPPIMLTTGNVGGSPTSTSGAVIDNVPGLADPFEHRPVEGRLQWRADAGAPARDFWGRPYLVFGWEKSPFIVSMGPDGDYDRAADNIRLEIGN
jgi:hypothetical protein